MTGEVKGWARIRDGKDRAPSISEVEEGGFAFALQDDVEAPDGEAVAVRSLVGDEPVAPLWRDDPINRD